MTASILCMIAERRSILCIGVWHRGASYADAQYSGRYGRCIVKGYPCVSLDRPANNSGFRYLLDDACN